MTDYKLTLNMFYYKLAVDNGARIEAKHFYTLQTSLDFAYQKGHQEIVDYLLSVQGRNSETAVPYQMTKSGFVSQRQLRQEAVRMCLDKP